MEGLKPLLTQANKSGYVQPLVTSTTTSIPEEFVAFNELIGLPRHPVTFSPHPITNIQRTFIETYCHKDRQDRVHLNKARQCGWTELILRHLAHQAFFKYKGKKIIIIASTKLQTTKQIYARFLGLFVNLRSEIAETGSLYLRLKNGTEIYGVSANEEAITGWTKVGCIFMDEAAKWDLIDDQPVLNSMLPIVRTNNSDIFMISTPKGPRGFFYNIEMNKESTFAKPVYDIHAGGQELYSNEQRMEMINSSEEDPQQEYLNQYTMGRNSYFGNDFKKGEHEQETY